MERVVWGGQPLRTRFAPSLAGGRSSRAQRQPQLPHATAAASPCCMHCCSVARQLASRSVSSGSDSAAEARPTAATFASHSSACSSSPPSFSSAEAQGQGDMDARARLHGHARALRRHPTLSRHPLQRTFVLLRLRCRLLQALLHHRAKHSCCGGGGSLGGGKGPAAGVCQQLHPHIEQQLSSLLLTFQAQPREGRTCAQHSGGQLRQEFQHAAAAAGGGPSRRQTERIRRRLKAGTAVHARRRQQAAAGSKQAVVSAGRPSCATRMASRVNGGCHGGDPRQQQPQHGFQVRLLRRWLWRQPQRGACARSLRWAKHLAAQAAQLLCYPLHSRL